MYSLCYRYSGCVVAVPPGRMWALAGRERRVEPAGSWKVPWAWWAPGFDLVNRILLRGAKKVSRAS